MFRRYACVRQNDQSDCGAAALATIAVHHRRPVGLERLRDLAGTDRVGTNLLGLVTAAESLGFSARAVKGPYEALREVPLPAVAHVKNAEGLGHFVVLHHVRRDSVIVADPARGVRKLTREGFSNAWTGYLLVLVPAGPATTRESTDGPVSPSRRFLRLLAPLAPVLAEAFVCAILLTGLGLSTSFFIRHLVDSVLVHGEWRLMNALAIGMLGIVLFRTLFGVLRQYLLIHVGRRIDLNLISAYTRHVLRLPMGFFDMRRVGEILSRVTDASRIRAAVSGATLSTIVDGTLVAMTAAIMFVYDAPLACVALAFVPALIVSVVAHHPGARRLSRQTMEKAAALQSHMVEDIGGVETIKAFGIEAQRSDEGDTRLVKVVQSGFSLQLLGLSMNSLATFIKGTAAIVVLWYGGHRVIDGALSIGELMFFYSLLGYVLEPLQRLSCVNLSIQEALVAVDRLYQIMDVEPERRDEQKKAVFCELRDAIKLEDVSFKYGCRDKVLENVHLRIPAGETVAIVGESGSGKSTLLKLLTRFYDPTDGRVLFDGMDARHLKLDSVRRRIGVVSQEPYVFSGTIRENIALYQPDASPEEIAAATSAAGLDDFIASLPDRLETVIGERGANLSGGQKQRLAIARALVRKPEILVFDEATSHLDTVTERFIQSRLRSVLGGKTVVIVAHRLSTVRSADRIYVLDGGAVTEHGTHSELIAAQGRYAHLWRQQAGEVEDGRALCLDSNARDWSAVGKRHRERNGRSVGAVRP